MCIRDSNWMGRYFFTGGLMPAADTLLSFQDDLDVEERWLHDGTHYQRTARGWLDNMDNHAEAVLQIMRETYGADEMFVWQQRWRIFFMACEELFGFNQGAEWGVSHYLFQKNT